MSQILHREFTATVAHVYPWGLLVQVEAGVDIIVDLTKIGADAPSVGAQVQVVILDDTRVPARGSLLKLDREIAARLRGDEF